MCQLITKIALLSLKPIMSSLAKAGLVCALPARTTILAAANPVGGHYSRSKTVHENIDLKPSLLSRFDLIFLMLDRPNIVKIIINLS